MKNCKIVVRMSKNNQLRNLNGYNISINDSESKFLNKQNNWLNWEVEDGSYTIKISNDYFTQTQECTVKNGKTKTVTITQNVPLQLIVGFTLGLSITAAVICFFISKSFSIAMLIPFISLLTVKKDSDKNNFEIIMQ